MDYRVIADHITNPDAGAVDFLSPGKTTENPHKKQYNKYLFHFLILSCKSKTKS